MLVTNKDKRTRSTIASEMLRGASGALLSNLLKSIFARPRSDTIRMFVRCAARLSREQRLAEDANIRASIAVPV